MELDALVELLAERVAVAMAKKPCLLLLPQEQNPECLKAPETCGFDRERTGKVYELCCARTVSYRPDWAQIRGVTAFGLTVEAMARIALGIPDDCYTRAMTRAILHGKPIYILQSQVELFSFEKSAPPAYFKRMKGYLDILTDAGLIIAEEGELEARILAGANSGMSETGNAGVAAAGNPVMTEGAEYEAVLSGRLITEADMDKAIAGGALHVRVQQRAIVTDLAADLAKKKGVAVIRGN